MTTPGPQTTIPLINGNPAPADIDAIARAVAAHIGIPYDNLIVADHTYDGLLPGAYSIAYGPGPDNDWPGGFVDALRAGTATIPAGWTIDDRTRHAIAVYPAPDDAPYSPAKDAGRVLLYRTEGDQQVPAELFDELVHEYAPHAHGEHPHDPYEAAAAWHLYRTRPWLLIERNVSGGTWMSSHDTAENAAACHRDQPDAADWSAVELVDLPNGHRHPGDAHPAFVAHDVLTAVNPARNPCRVDRLHIAHPVRNGNGPAYPCPGDPHGTRTGEEAEQAGRGSQHDTLPRAELSEMLDTVDDEQGPANHTEDDYAAGWHGAVAALRDLITRGPAPTGG